MKVSAIIPAFNRKNHIRRAIDSVLAQTVPVDEIIVVDDGSSDGTADAVEAWYGSSVRLIRQSNTGVAGARHRGIREARGEWIAFLDSDDEWIADRNATLLDAAAKLPADVAWLFGDLRIVTDEGEWKTIFEEFGLTVTKSPQIFTDSLAVQHPFQFGMLQGSFIRRSAFLELNCFSEGLRSDDDLLAGFQVACRYRVAAIPAVVGKYFRTSDLGDNSVVLNGVNGPDYFRSRMMAFSGVMESGRGRRPWNMYYASEARGLCKVLARRGQEVPRTLVMQQFRYGGISAKGLAFFAVAMMGQRAIRAWMALGSWRRKYVLRERREAATNAFQAQVQAAVERNS